MLTQVTAKGKEHSKYTIQGQGKLLLVNADWQFVIFNKVFAFV